MSDDSESASTSWNGNEYIAFHELMQLEKLDDWKFSSITKPFSPSGSTAAYGGHVYAQAVYAASKTVTDGMVVCVCS